MTRGQIRTAIPSGSFHGTSADVGADDRGATSRPVAHSAGSVFLRRALVALDLVALSLAWATALLLTSPAAAGHRPAGTSLVLAATLVGVALWLNVTQGLYRSRVCNLRSVETSLLCRVGFLTAVIALAGSEVLDVTILASELIAGAASSVVALLVARGGYRAWLSAKRRQGHHLRSVVLIGANDEALEIFRILEAHPEDGYEIAGVLGCHAEVCRLGMGHKWLGPIDVANAAIELVGASGAVLTISAIAPTELQPIVRQLERAGVHVHVSIGLRGVATRRLRAMPLAHEPLFYLEPAPLAGWQLVLKRAMDLVIGLVALIVAAPCLAACALAIKLQDGGPVLFRQQRVGRNGDLFSIYKLRTMVVDAEARRHELMTLNEREGPLFKVARDPRVTRVGGLLRAANIDELPQLLNVLRGTMSLVGPRPALPDESAHFDEALQTRTRVRPGMTGLWQVEACEHPSFAAYRRYDLFYLENWSVGLDLVIMLATLELVAFRMLSHVHALLSMAWPRPRTSPVAGPEPEIASQLPGS